MVFTFKNHPRAFINKDNAPKLLMSNEKKIKLLENYKVDMVCLKEFDAEFMGITPKEFIKSLID